MGKVTSTKNKIFNIMSSHGIYHLDGDDYYKYLIRFCELYSLKPPESFKKNKLNFWYCNLEFSLNGVRLINRGHQPIHKKRKLIKRRSAKRVGWIDHSKKDKIFNVHKTFGISGIYFLYFRNEIVYIGQSSCVMNRISTHYNDNIKIFDGFSIKRLSGSRQFRESIERKYILKHSPYYNKTNISEK